MRSKFFIKNLCFYIIPLLIPLLLLGGFAISITQGFIREDINKRNERMLIQLKESLELLFDEVDTISLNFNVNPYMSLRFKDLLENEYSSYNQLEIANVFRNFADAPVNSKSYLQSVYIYSQNSKGNFLASREGLVNLDHFNDISWYRSFCASSDATNIWIEARRVKLYPFEAKATPLISVYKKLYSPGVTKADGVIVMNFKRDYIDQLLNSLTVLPGQKTFILDSRDRIICADTNWFSLNNIALDKIKGRTEKFLALQSGGRSFMVSQIRSARNSLKYISIVPRSVLYKVPIQLGFFTVLLLAVSFLLGLAFTYYLTRRTYNNIVQIVSTFDSAKQGRPLPPPPPKVKDEYGFIQQNIINTFIEQNYLKVQLSEKKYRLKAMEIVALQSQINPHFLFNTLKIIFWKAVGLTGNQNEVSKMIEFLADILHFSLANPDKTVTLGEEIKNTQSYIAIQKIRYKDKFHVIWQYDEAVEAYPVMKLLLQPLIENCIYHGIKEKEAKSCIKIKILPDGNGVRITVTDNGLGMARERLRELREHLLLDGEFAEHIGLSNTNKRLKLTYGEDCSLRIRSKAGFGTSVCIRIPLPNGPA